MKQQKTSSSKRRKQTYEAGLFAEVVAKFMLRLKGYRIIEQRYKTQVGEIDLIAKRGSHIAFIEVKYRQTLEDAAFSLSDHQKKRISKTANLWLAKQSDMSYESLSFDAILFAPWKLPNHIKNAFDEM